MVTVQVDDEVWRYLTVRKDPGDALNDVLRRELGLADDSDGEEPAAGVEGVLDGWTPDTEASAAVARRETARAAEWLRETGGRHTRSAFVDALAGDVELSERGWWERHVQPGLRRLAERELVEYRAGHHDYRWSG